MKRKIESAAECVHHLSTTESLDEIASLAALETAPSRPHACTLEAVVILLTPANRFQPPERSFAHKC